MKRLKIYILTMISLLAMACSSSDEPAANLQPGEAYVPETPQTQTDGDAIGFTASLDGQSASTRTNFGNTIVYGFGPKAQEVDPALSPFHDGIESQTQFQSTGFGVFGFYTGEQTLESASEIEDKEIVMLNQHVEYSGGKWTYSPLRFWPGGSNMMSFFAYAPYGDGWVPSIGAVGTDYIIHTEEGDWKNAATYLDGHSIQTPKFRWDNKDQVDVLWGMAKASGTTFAEGKAYKNIKRPSDGKLNWSFIHALARIKFSIYNYMNIMGAYDKIVGIKPETGNKLTVKINGHNEELQLADQVVYPISINRYVAADDEDPELSGWYAHLHELDEHHIPKTVRCHKFVPMEENSRRLIITGVSLKNLVTQAELDFDNTAVEAWKPNWDIIERDKFSIPASLLNNAFYDSNISAIDVTAADWEDQWEALPKLDSNDMPLIIFNSDLGSPYSTYAAANKDHYLLVVPRNPEEEQDNQKLAVNIEYKVASLYQLEGNYDWQLSGGKPTKITNEGTFSYFGMSVPDNPFEIAAPIDIELKANHTYHMKMQLGEMMYVQFEVTNWDLDEEADYNITVPTFD